MATNLGASPLFYILIAVLGAFALVSLVNFLRSRRRRSIVFAEAERLGLMVPGMDGYVPMRDRPMLEKVDGWRTPDWWEVGERRAGESTTPPPPAAPGYPNGHGTHHAVGLHTARDGGAPAPHYAHGADVPSHNDRAQHSAGAGTEHEDATVSTPTRFHTPPSSPPPLDAPSPDNDYGARGQLEIKAMDDLQPLSLIPQPLVVNEPAKPISPIPFFPNYVSYLKTAHDPKPPRFAPENPDAFNDIVGEPMEVVVAVRMPRPPVQRETPIDPDDDNAVMDEWGGLELGVASWTIVKA